MKALRLFLLLAAASGSGSLVLADTAAPDSGDTGGYTPYQPKQYDLSRYEHMRKKSPFEFEPPTPPVPETVDPFEGVTLAGFAGSGKKLTVYLSVGKEKTRVTVYGDASPMRAKDESGYRIVEFKRGKSLATSEVVLERNGVTKGIKFTEDTLKNAKGGAAGGGAGGQQGGVQMVPGPNGTMVPRPVIPRPNPVGGNAAVNNQPPAPFIPGQSNPVNNTINNGSNAANPLNVQPTVPQQAINNMTMQPQGTQPVIPNVPQPPSSGDGRGRRRVVLPTPP